MNQIVWLIDHQSIIEALLIGGTLTNGLLMRSYLGVSRRLAKSSFVLFKCVDGYYSKGPTWDKICVRQVLFGSEPSLDRLSTACQV